jgi:dihydropteroate synthase-like protein
LAIVNASWQVMVERILFVTGHLARPRLEKLLLAMQPTPFEFSIVDIGVKVAALMSEAILMRRLPRPIAAERVILPGRCRADLKHLSAEFGVPFERGPDELKDLPTYFGKGGRSVDLSGYDVRIFAEIVDASVLSVDAIMAKAAHLRTAGADVIDLGCLPDTQFVHLDECVRVLKSAGFQVSVDSADSSELRRGAVAGADFLLSLTQETLDVADGTAAIPVLVPLVHGDLSSLLGAAEVASKRGLQVILDPILDPVHFGFTASLERYATLRRLMPEAEILMGTGNLTELTDADSGGVTAMLMSICSELHITNILSVQVSPHTRRTIEEHDAARRLMFAAKRDHSLPRDYGAGLLQLHDRAPFPNTASDISEIAAMVRDPNFRIETASDGIHIYNRHGHHVAQDAFTLFPKLAITADAPHAFYLGAELMKAEISWRLGKRYAQDEPLDWGCGADQKSENEERFREVGHTLRRCPAEVRSDDDD